MSNDKFAVFVNKSANNGKSKKKWEEIKKLVNKNLPDNTVYYEYSPPFDLDKLIKNLIGKNGTNCFIAVGGDGTLFYLLNALTQINSCRLQHIFLGAIGLGSSNDFCKINSSSSKGYKFRIGKSKSEPADIGFVTLYNGKKKQSKYFISNASIGFLSNANALFNSNDLVINFLKKRFVEFAINYTAIASIFKHKNCSLSISYGSEQYTRNITNLSILKSPNVAGSFRYPSNISPNDGLFDIKLCSDQSKLELSHTLFQLYMNKFQGKKLSSFNTNQITVESDKDFFVELDGELFGASKAEFQIMPSSINTLNFLQ